MTRRNTQKILAIDPGTRNIGVAVLEGDRICYTGVKQLPKCRSGEETLTRGRQAIRELIADFRPAILAVERTYFPRDRNGRALNRFAAQISVVGRSNGLRVVCLSTPTIRRAICGSGRAGKRDVAAVLASRYPELRPFRTANKRWKQRYFYNMFDAVAVGLSVGLNENKREAGYKLSSTGSFPDGKGIG